MKVLETHCSVCVHPFLRLLNYKEALGSDLITLHTKCLKCGNESRYHNTEEVWDKVIESE